MSSALISSAYRNQEHDPARPTGSNSLQLLVKSDVVAQEPQQAMNTRFYVPTSLNVPAVELVGQEAHHLTRVLRKSVGETVCLFDGRGTEATGQIVTLSKRVVELQIVETWSVSDVGLGTVILGTAVPKGDRFRWLVEKATELGVARLVPLKTDRSVVNPSTEKLQKLRQTVIAASKQCGRNRLMKIVQPTAWHNFVLQEFPDRTAFVAHPAGQPIWQIMGQPMSNEVVVAVGPEGGFTDLELEQAIQAGARLIDLGHQILRIETAGIVLATVLGLCAIPTSEDKH